MKKYIRRCKCGCGKKIYSYVSQKRKFYSLKCYWKWLKGKTPIEKYGKNIAKKIQKKIKQKKSGFNHPLYKKNYEKYYGNKRAKEIKNKQSKSNSGSKNILYKKTYEDVYGKKIANKMVKIRSGKKSNFYKDGNGYYGYDGFTGAIKRKILRIYKNVCQVCFKKDTNGQIHHITYNPKNNKIKALTYLCFKHHRFVHRKSENKDYWFAYFCYQNNIEPEVII